MFGNKHNGYSPDGARPLHKGGGIGGFVGGIVDSVSSLVTGKPTKEERKAERHEKAARAAAQAEAKRQEQYVNRQEKKYADSTGLLSQSAASLTSAMNTVLTGLEGVDDESLLLGRKKTLGG